MQQHNCDAGGSVPVELSREPIVHEKAIPKAANRVRSHFQPAVQPLDLVSERCFLDNEILPGTNIYAQACVQLWRLECNI